MEGPKPSRLSFDVANANNLTFYYEMKMHMDRNSWIDFDSIPIYSQIKRLQDTHDMITELKLGNISYSRIFEVEADDLELLSNIRDY